VPAAFTYDTGKQHWETLLKARAIENLSFVLASDQCGTHNNGRKTFGHSMIVSPWGDKLAECQDLPGLAFASIDFDQMHKIRQRFPCIDHQKLDYIM
jgi:predicted amidohydrolase